MLFWPEMIIGAVLEGTKTSAECRNLCFSLLMCLAKLKKSEKYIISKGLKFEDRCIKFQIDALGGGLKVTIF